MKKIDLIGLTGLITIMSVLVLSGAVQANNMVIGEQHSSRDSLADYTSEWKHPSLSSALVQLTEQAYVKGFSGANVNTGIPNGDKENRITVIVEAGEHSIDTLISTLSVLNANVEASNGNFVQVNTPIELLTQIADLPEVKFVRLPTRALPGVASEGLDPIGAPLWQSNSMSGSGVKVAILDGGFEGYQGLLGTELPETVTIYHPQGQSDISGWGPHGAACAEIVHDIAPDAQIYLVLFQTEVDWLNAVDWLIEQEVDIVSHSVSWMFSGPGDGTGWACEKIAQARDSGIFWSQSAGNYAKTHWQGRFSDGDQDSVHNFNSNDEDNRVWLQAGKKAEIALRWDDPWEASSNDYDLYLLDNSGTIVASSTDLQDGDDHPQERIESFIYSSGWHSIQIKLSSGDGSAWFDLFTPEIEPEHQVAWGSILDPADAAAALTTGAFPWDNPDLLRGYSGRGPTSDSRTKPDLLAPDGVITQTYGKPFYGTSASTAHVAGAAALIMQYYPEFSPFQVKTLLMARALSDSPAANNISGSGRLYLDDLPLTVLVGKDLTNDPQNHTFDNISDGVSHANPGDTVRVGPGLYKERVVVDKPLIMKGIDSPIVDAKFYTSAISLSADGCTLTGFDLCRGGWEAEDGALQVLSDGNRIDNTIVRDSWNGVCLWSCSDNLLGGITVRDNYYGITAIDGQSNLLMYNTFRDNGINGWDNSAGNFWDNGWAGNLWDDYADRYPGAMEIDGSGVWDTPYAVNGGPASDEFPLVDPPFHITVTEPAQGSEFTSGAEFFTYVNVVNRGPLPLEHISVELYPGQYADLIDGGASVRYLDYLAEGASGTLTWKLKTGLESGVNSITARAEADIVGNLTVNSSDIIDITIAGWDPWIYDLNDDSILEYGEMVAALMAYLSKTINYDQMVDVLMIYLNP